MSMRISDKIAGAGLLCLALAACDSQSAALPDATLGRAAVAECAIGPRAEWTRNCLVEQSGKLLTVRHGDGGFRRFTILEDGRGLAAADGAEPANVAIVGKGQIEVSAGEERYRLPATIAGATKP
ncbi:MULTISPECIES: hypothetical protein [Sphingobium]|uniref:Lipoprotein n=1 Tax=Sphingobium tyrosinilyticum TaxID=2715436 RepID=A0ABV9F299_9SPHN|nr:hypothetical protein [Sphingobium sp. EP60837]ANI76598.1 hypothetical protein EP837_00143 [Sphingobium sp. EP60837]